SLFLFYDRLREAPQIIGSLARLARGRENRAVVVLEKLYPVVDVAGVAQLSDDAKMGAQECCSQLGNQLLGSVRLLVEAALEVAAEAALVTGPMSQLVQCRGIEATRLAERALRRQSDEVESRDKA